VDGAADDLLGDRQSLIDGRALAAALKASTAEGGDIVRARAAALAVLRPTLESARTEIRRRFEAQTVAQSGAACLMQYGFVMDTLLAVLFDHALGHVFPVANPTMGEQLSLIAVGGYGRNELAPQSDIDLLFLVPYKRTPRVEQVTEFILYLLWDLGLKVGHAVRTVDECIRTAKADGQIRTTLLEMRAIAGEPSLYADLRRRFARDVMTGTAQQFIAEKLAERDKRHLKLGDSRYLVEPNVKDGKGGLRDLHLLFWIAKDMYQVDDIADLVTRGVFTQNEAETFARCAQFLWMVRCHLHYVTGRPEERLTFDLQPEIGRRMGYADRRGNLAVERFMKHYFHTAKAVGDLSRIFTAAIEADLRRSSMAGRLKYRFGRRALEGFAEDGEMLDLARPDQLLDRPLDTLRLFDVAHRHGLSIHPNALRALTRAHKLVGPKLRNDAEANRLFLDILLSKRNPVETLRAMNEAGVLGRFVPEFGRVVAQMQFDMYHVYTVDEHSLRAIGILNEIESGARKETIPHVTEIAQKITQRRVLYCAVLLHDIAKGRGGDHSEIGERIAERLCPRFGLSAQETETVAWLVRWHLAMSSAALKRDIEDPQTVKDFVALVQSPERLRLLYVLTAADITAVGPGRWNSWKGTLLATLYDRAADLMSGGITSEAQEERVARAVETLRAEAQDLPAPALDDFIATAPSALMLSFPPPLLARYARMIAAAKAGGEALPHVEMVDFPTSAISEVTIYAEDENGLFAKLAGAIAESGGNILDAKIFTMADGRVLDVFWLAHDTATLERQRRERLVASVRTAVHAAAYAFALPESVIQAALRKHGAFPVVPRVLVDNEASSTHTVIEVNGRDRPGLLYELTHALAEQHVRIASAKISTYGESAVDVFYVKDAFGLKIAKADRVAALEEALTAVLMRRIEPAAKRDGGRAEAAKRIAPVATRAPHAFSDAP
jgi:[protein-PII] uridylyltransferase